MLNKIISFWKSFYEDPNSAESSWGYFTVLKDGFITGATWSTLLPPVTLITLIIVDSVKNLINNRYRQTFRNIFNGHKTNSKILNFCFYYMKRMSYNILTGIIIGAVAYQSALLTLPIFIHVITSRIFSSSHFLINFYEDNLIFKGRINRSTVAHVGGIASTCGAILGNLDLAGVSWFGIELRWYSLGLSIVVFMFYFSVSTINMFKDKIEELSFISTAPNLINKE